MKILFITDTPINRINDGFYGKKEGLALHTLSTNIEFFLAEDVLNENRMRGRAYDMVMIPRTLEFVEDLHQKVYEVAKSVTQYSKGIISYYGIPQ